MIAAESIAVMVIAVVLAVGIMMLSAGSVSALPGVDRASESFTDLVSKERLTLGVALAANNLWTAGLAVCAAVATKRPTIVIMIASSINEKPAVLFDVTCAPRIIRSAPLSTLHHSNHSTF